MAPLPETGVVDADGHVLEDADLWDRYLEPAYRDRPIRIVQDEAGWDVLEVAGQRFPYMDPGQIAMMGTMGEALPIPGPSGATPRPAPLAAPSRASASNDSTTRASTPPCSIPRSDSNGSAPSPTPRSTTPTCAPTTAGSPISVATRAGASCRSPIFRCGIRCSLHRN